MQKIYIKLLAILLLPFVAKAQTQTNPIVFGNNRLTLITPTLFRLEYAINGKFLDNETLFAGNRETLLQDFKVQELGDNRYEITTSALSMVYHHDDFPFGMWNFEVFYQKDGKKCRFTNRGRQTQNLGGAISTLDRVDGAIPLNEGLLSRDGWYIINDTGKDIVVDGWIAERDRDHVQDQYCFVYGNDYRAALTSLGAICGNTPMTRRYVHGMWYCRYWDYTTQDYIDIVEGYKQHDFPLDNLVFDMGWHTYDATVGTGHSNNRSWTGYTWNRKLISNPAALVKYFNDDHIRISLNEHPHDGIRPNESMYADFMKAMGEDPTSGKTLLFDAGDRKYMTNFLKYAHGESWNMGISFWWLDWQQNYLYPFVRGTSTSHLGWLNRLYFEESKIKGRRGAGYSRWAGWGDHRYPIQFSGDAYASWETLRFEIELTATSGNAGCFFWAHDLGGFYEKEYDSELYARWIQFGAVSAALRIHSMLDPKADRRPWLWGDQAEESMRESYHLRAKLMPYVYSSVYQTHKSMVPLNRAMYIDYGHYAESYENPQQFMFGDLLLAAPITNKGCGKEKTASQQVWFPEGEVWYDIFDGTPYHGGSSVTVTKDLNSFPLFVKGGYLLPMQPYSERPASATLDTLVLRCYPADRNIDTSYTLYEDDGESCEYENGAFATTRLQYCQQGASTILTIHPTEGHYVGQPLKRAYKIECRGIDCIDKLKINNKKATAKNDKDGFIISISPQDIHKKITISYIK